MANLFGNSKFENFQKFPLLHGIAHYSFISVKESLQPGAVYEGKNNIVDA